MTPFATHTNALFVFLRPVTVWVGVLMGSSALAGNYPLGSMTCKEVGQFASEAMQWREAGVTPDQALQRLQDKQPADTVEKKNMRMVLSLVYGGYGDSWTVKSAGDAMRIDCETGRQNP